MALAQLINKGPSLAELLRRQGRGKDTILAHINAREAALLKRHGGSGKMNPRTGLPEFDDSTDTFTSDITAEPLAPPVEQPAPTPDVSPSAPSPDVSTDASGFTPDPSFFFPDFSSGPSGGGGAAASPSGGSADFVTTSPFATDVGAGPAPVDLSGLGGGGVDAATGGGGSGQESYGQKLLDTVTKPTNLAKILGGAGTGLLGMMQSNKAAKQAQAQAQQISNLGAPFSQQGNNILAATQAGALTPMSGQTYQAAQAKLAQDAVNRGGVGAQQNIAIAEQLRQQLLQNQFTAGLNLVQVGNQYTMAGIKESIVANQEVNQATQQFYAALFKGIGSIS